MELRSQEKDNELFENIVKKIKDSEKKEVEVSLDDAIKKGKLKLNNFMDILNGDEEWVVDILINLFDENGNTLLHLAVSKENSAAVENLLKKKADPLIANHEGKLPSDIAYIKYEKNQSDPKLVKIKEIFEATLYSATKKPAKKALHGYIFQTRLMMLCVLYANELKLKFRLLTEFDEAECFDDIVFETTESEKKIYRFIQAKHKLNTKPQISKGDFFKQPWTAKGKKNNGDDFSIPKYFQAFLKMRYKNFFKSEQENQEVEKYFILVTNSDFAPEAFCEIQKYIGVEEGDKLPLNDVLPLNIIPNEAKKYRFCSERTALMKNVHDKLKNIATLEIKKVQKIISRNSDDSDESENPEGSEDPEGSVDPGGSKDPEGSEGDDFFEEIIQHVPSLEEYDENGFNTFLNNFRFITNFPNEKKLEKLILKKIEKKFTQKNHIHLNADLVSAYFFKEMLHFLYKGNKNKAVIYTNKHLDEFIEKLRNIASENPKL